MLKRISVLSVMVLCSLILLTGCNENKEDTKLLEISKANDISVTTCADGGKSVKLSVMDFKKVIEIYYSTINNTNGKSIDNVEDELVYGDYGLVFYNNGKEIDYMGYNGHYFIYKEEYYYIPDEKYEELQSVFDRVVFDTNKNKEDLDSITKVSIQISSFYDNEKTVDKDTGNRIIKLVKRILNTSKPKTKEECKKSQTSDGYILHFYNKNNKAVDLYLVSKFVVFKDKYYEISEEDNTRINLLLKDKGYISDVKPETTTGSKEITADKNNLNNIAKISISTKSSDKEKVLSYDAKERIIKIFNRTINNTKGKSLKEIKKKPANDSYNLTFYDKDNKKVDLSNKGKYVVYKDKYYEMSEDDYGKLDASLRSEGVTSNEVKESSDSNKAVLNDIVKATVYTDNKTDEKVLDEKGRKIVTSIFERVISQSKSESKKENEKEVVYGGINFCLSDTNKNETELCISGKHIIYNDKFYKISEDDYHELKKYLKDNKYI